MLQLTLSIGIAASLLMFCGDMLLYFTDEDYRPDGTLRPIIEIMKKLPDWRLMAGGIIGPIASFFYCIAFYHINIIIMEEYRILAFIILVFCTMGMIMSGAYHSHCTYLGIISKSGSDADMEKVIKYIKLLSGISFLFLAFGFTLLGGMMILGKTLLPRYYILFTPFTLFYFKLLWKKLPQPFLIILYGGWYNLMFTIYFLSVLFFMPF